MELLPQRLQLRLQSTTDHQLSQTLRWQLKLPPQSKRLQLMSHLHRLPSRLSRRIWRLTLNQKRTRKMMQLLKKMTSQLSKKTPMQVTRKKLARELSMMKSQSKTKPILMKFLTLRKTIMRTKVPPKWMLLKMITSKMKMLKPMRTKMEMSQMLMSLRRTRKNKMTMPTKQPRSKITPIIRKRILIRMTSQRRMKAVKMILKMNQ